MSDRPTASAARFMTSEDRISESTITFQLNRSQFLVSDRELAKVEVQPSRYQKLSDSILGQQKPVTVLSTGTSKEIDASWLGACLRSLLASDDVLERAFTSTIMFQIGSNEVPILADDAILQLRLWQTVEYYFFTAPLEVRSGPYFISGSGLRQVYKLQADPYGAFICGVVESTSDTSKYRPYPSNLIPVPSRLYSGPPTDLQPLLGKRLAVKDICDIRGLKTGLCCRAYEAFYGAAEITAPSIAELLALGAVLVGKTKTTQLASGERPVDWVDYQCPFNPRGDGYFNPDCSSTGSAAAVAAYSWLDYSVGSDTLGSMSGPAALQGIYGIRPTHGSLFQQSPLSLRGIAPVSSVLDTLGFFSRSINDFSVFAKAWYGEDRIGREVEKIFLRVPTTLLVPSSSFDAFPQAKQDIMYEFIGDFEKTFGLFRTEFDLSSSWKEVSPTWSLDLKNFLHTTVADIQLRDSYRNNALFRGAYQEKHGHQPYVNPMVRYKWTLGSQISESEYDEARRRKVTFANFLRDNVLDDGTVMLLPGGYPELGYRDDNEDFLDAALNMQGYGFKDINYSVLGGLPLITFPVGQTPIRSKVTQAIVYEPVSMMLLGPAGNDNYLIALLKRVLESSGRPLEVKTGPEAFEVVSPQHSKP